MRILFVSAPLIGHLFPMVPLAVALREAGHEVRVAAGGDAAAARPAGLEVDDVVPGFDFSRIARRVLLRHPLIGRAELAGKAGTRGVALLFGAVNDQLLDGAVRLAREWSPDLVVYEPLAAAGAHAAAEVGVPAVLHGNTLFDEAELVRVTTAAMRHQRPDGLPADRLVLSVAPPSLVGPREVRPMRFVSYGGEGELPELLREPPEDGRPRVLVTHSTVPGPGGGDLIGAAIAAASGVDAEVVLVRPDATRDLPPNVRAVGWTPFAEALPTCAGVVHHGGAGTLLAALAAGVPQIVVPGPGDRRRNAELVAARGAGLAVPVRQIDADVLRRLLTDAKLAAAAAEVRDEMAGLPHPADLVPDLTS
ncbi:nucleotide disphospho-sugar-binding domain-containing protein [Phytohabitans sp. LJ34]|uniref:nucleotide disphospho-sugar-binding domain-containing protein n=1 Tax=Phytohabitans sp. LJ34 TaxID=3452217 RepID=UPI003F88A446